MAGFAGLSCSQPISSGADARNFFFAALTSIAGYGNRDGSSLAVTRSRLGGTMANWLWIGSATALCLQWMVIHFTGAHRSPELQALCSAVAIFGAAFSPARLSTRAENHVPTFSEAGQIDYFILSSIDGATSNGDIAHRLLIQFPGHFADWQAGLTRVGDLAQRYGRSASANELRRRDSRQR